MQHFLIGNLTWEALPHQWFTIGATLFLLSAGIVSVIALTYLKRWSWLWGYMTSTDPKKVGIMYIVVASAMLFRGGLDAVMIWLQQSMASGANQGYLDASHFQQIFTAHGDIMVFFVTMGFLFGLLNFILPLQIGTRDLAYPFLNSLGFWLYLAGAIFINLFFVVGGDFAATGWLSLPPLSELAYNAGVGVDYWTWSLQISGLGTLIGGINFLVTILKNRAPGMTMMRLPMFVWTSFVSMVLVVTVFPILTVTIALLWLDRFMGMHFFTSSFGGNPMMYINLIWMWGHPEVYILVLPVFGVYSEIVATYSKKKLYGYQSQVLAAFSIMGLAALVWLHHFFTMGAGADVNAFFGIMTMLITIPTGVQIFNWISTMWRGKVIFSNPMLWFFGFLSTFTFGGMAGVLLASPAADYQLHNSLFLVAHFHTMAIGGALFGIFAGIIYWFPKFTGFKLNERIGRYAFWTWLVGFFVSFVPLYILGFMGATRRLNHYDASTGWQPLFMTSLVGVMIIGVATGLQVWQIIVSVRQRNQNRDLTGDPWDGRTLEWAAASPPPSYNFAVIPKVESRDAFWAMKQNPNPTQVVYEDIHMSKNTPLGIYLSGFIFLIGFAFVWHIGWLGWMSFVGALAVVVYRGLEKETEFVIPAAEVQRMEEERKHA